MTPPIINQISYSGDKWFTLITMEGAEYFGSGEVWYQVEPGTGKLIDVDDMQVYSDLMAVHNKAVHLNVLTAMRAQLMNESKLLIGK